ncbi:FAD dependent oxidoreductase domain-containing protein [Sarocladium implicatum]|nr:FAD dependent oxidoreductase domain-containing protein [Sarocladium implicatum]
MARGIQSLSRGYKIAAAAAATTVLGGGFYLSYSRKPHLKQPLVDLRRDDQGRIVAPTFHAIKSRGEQLAELRRNNGASPDEEYDLLVVGGGATGTGIALDAASRGLKVALVERDDFSSGTSSKSTKLVHGGVRYLEKAVMSLDYPQLQLVMEALRERRTFLDIAPHLSTSLPIILPLQGWLQAPYMFAGIKAYDILAGSRGLESSYVMSKDEALRKLPTLRKDHLVGALVYYDGQHNDSRMNVSLALTAQLYGATVLNHVEVTNLEKDANGKICGVKVKDLAADLAGDHAAAKDFTVRAKGVINATGPFTDAIEKMDDGNRKDLVVPASGTHIMLSGDLCPEGMGMLDASTSDGRVVFVLPWQGYTLAGTTDNGCPVQTNPIPPQEDVDFILKEVSKLMSPVKREDVLASWTGIRPLIKDPKAKNTESLVRSHLVTVSPAGLLTCAGGKWTTYRQMAEDAVDEAIETFNLKPKAGVAFADISGSGAPGITSTGKCITRDVPLIGAHGFSPELAGHLMDVHKIDQDIASHLASNYGDRAWAVLRAAKSPASRLLPKLPFIEAEVRHAVHYEAAVTATDVIARRMRLSFLDVNESLKALKQVIAIMGEELDWSEKRRRQEFNDSVGFLRSMGLSESTASESLGLPAGGLLKSTE